MTRLQVLILSSFLALPALAATVTPEAIKKAADGVAADPAKVTAYCAMLKKMDEVGDDEKKAEAANAEIDGYLQTLGAEFEAVWNGTQDTAEDSPESKAFEDAMDKLEEKCK